MRAKVLDTGNQPSSARAEDVLGSGVDDGCPVDHGQTCTSDEAQTDSRSKARADGRRKAGTDRHHRIAVTVKSFAAGFGLTLAVLALFAVGNLCAHLGIVNIGQFFGLANPQTLSAASASDEVSTEQLAARLSEVSGYLDSESLYRYTQGDLDAATTAAIQSLIGQSGDDYAKYYTPKEYAEYLRSSEGEYSGIGIILSMYQDKLTVMQVYENSPAHDAGVMVGDLLLSVDGDSHEWGIEEATEFIRRPIGESVTILWQRGEEQRETTMTIREVNVPTIVTHLIDYDSKLIGYIYLRRFNNQSASELREVLAQLDGQGAQSFVLDLRGNPGGYLKQAIDVTSLFVADGVVTQIEDRHGIRQEGVNGKVCNDKPLTVLINQGSASASELVAAALQDHGRAAVVGEVSYGKGTVQDVRRLSWGGALKFTIAHYLSPNGKQLDGVGVTPDVIVAAQADPSVIGLSDRINSSAYRYLAGKDPQLDAALASLTNVP